MIFDPNPLYYKMVDIYHRNKTPDNKIIIINEGGTRSSKTWDAFHFILTFLDHNRNKGLECYVLRDTLTNCKDYTLKDFQGVLKKCELNFQMTNSQKPDFKIWGNNVHFRGLDDEENTEGYPSDILFINEMLETKKTKISGLKMRCRKLLIGDYNPKYLIHWVYDMEGQPDVFFTHSTYKNNKFLEPSIIKEIESYEPNEYNVTNKTADEFRWNVYGLGKRGTNTESVFKRFELFDEFPTHYDLRVFGMDFGYVNDPSTLVEVVIDGNNLYLKEHLYERGLLNVDIYNKVKNIIGLDTYVVADSAEPKSIVELRLLGLPIIAATKGADSIVHGVNKLLQFHIHLHKNSLNLRKEFVNYKFSKDKDNNVTNIPIKGNDHLIDPTRYAVTKFTR